MPFSISNISIEGTRGINDKIDLPFSEGLNLLYGPNGAGKSSVLQAIEWCLTGKLPYLRGPDFRREDAIVNLFHRKKQAKVTLTLSDGNETVLITRTRKMAKSTTAGSSDLEVNCNGKVLRDKDAQKEVERLIGLAVEDFPRAVYLHQEAIKELLSEDPEERSRAIDKLLGLIELRDLTETLDVKRKISSTIRRIEERIETLNRDKVQFAVHMRERLEEHKSRLQEKGYSTAQMTVVNLVGEMSKLEVDVSDFADKMKAPIPALHPPEPTIKAIVDLVAQFDETIHSLDRFRIKALQTAEERRLKLEDAKQQFELAQKELSSFGHITIESLAEERSKTGERVQNLASTVKKLQSLVTELSGARARIESLNGEATQLEAKLVGIESKYGDEKNHLNTLQEYADTLKGLREQISRFAVYDQLVSLAIQHISETHEDNCPVCAQPIDCSKVVSRLQTEIKASVAEEVKKLREGEKALTQLVRDVEKSLEDYRTTSSRLSISKENIKKTKGDTEARIGEPLGEDIAAKIEEAKGRIEQLTSEMNSKLQELNEVKGRYDALTTSSSRFTSTQKALQVLIGSTVIGEELIDAVELELRGTQEVKSRYQDVTELDALTGRISKIKEIIEFLKAEDEVREIEEQLPTITKLVSDLKSRIDGLSQLEGSLAALHQVASQYGKEAVTGTLSSLEDLLNQYYKAILGHPHFQDLRIHIEKEEPLLYSIRASGGEQTTYIPTRFSNAQMNVVALAMFFSNYSKMATNLRCIVIDDPTQSMDTEHKKALCKIMRELMKNNQLIVATQDAEIDALITKECVGMHKLDFKTWSVGGPIIELK